MRVAPATSTALTHPTCWFRSPLCLIRPTRISRRPRFSHRFRASDYLPSASIMELGLPGQRVAVRHCDRSFRDSPMCFQNGSKSGCSCTLMPWSRMKRRRVCVGAAGPPSRARWRGCRPPFGMPRSRARSSAARSAPDCRLSLRTISASDIILRKQDVDIGITTFFPSRGAMSKI